MEEQKGKISVSVNIRGLEEMSRVHNHVAEFVTSLCKYVPRCKERTTLFENWLHQQRNQTPYSADTRNMTNSPQYCAYNLLLAREYYTRVHTSRTCTHSMLMRLNIETAEPWTHRSERRMEFKLAFQRRRMLG